MSEETTMQNFVSELTDALLNDASSHQVNGIIGRSDVAALEADSWLHLIHRLKQGMLNEQPSEKFVNNLKRNLLGQQNETLTDKLRSLPARVHVAAGVAVVAGFMLITRRKLTVEANDQTDVADVAVLQQ